MNFKCTRSPLTKITAAPAILMLLHVAAVWAWPIFPSQDGMSHSETAAIITKILFSTSSTHRDVYTLNTQVLANWPSHIMLSLFMQITSAAAAEKILVSLYLFSTALAFHYCIVKIRGHSSLTVLCVFPLLYNNLLACGFYNFCLSISLFLVSIGYGLNSRRLECFKHYAQLGLLLFVTSLFHPVSAVTAFIFLFAARVARLSCPIKTLAVDAVRLCFSFAPTAALILASIPDYLVDGPSLSESNLTMRIYKFISGYMFVPYKWEFIWLGILLNLCLLGIIVGYIRNIWGSGVARSLALGCIFITLLYFSVPEAIGQGYFMSERILLLLYFSLALLVAISIRSFRTTAVIAGTFTIIALSSLLLRLQIHGEINKQYQEYLSISDLLPEDSPFVSLQILPYGLGTDGEPLVDWPQFFLHIGSGLTANTERINLLNYEPETGHFPIRYKSAINPLREILGAHYVDSGDIGMSNLIDYRLPKGSAVEFVVIWGPISGVVDSDVMANFERYYEAIFTSQPLALTRVYRRKKLVPELNQVWQR